MLHVAVQLLVKSFQYLSDYVCSMYSVKVLVFVFSQIWEYMCR